MPARRAKAKRTRHYARTWILRALRSEGASREVRGRQLRAQITKMSGAKIPDQSIYHALRVLIRKGEIRVTRAGRERSYRLVRGKRSGSVPSPAVATRAPALRPEAGPAPKGIEPEMRRELQKPGIGDIVILRIGDSFVETATNLNGRLKVERHAR